MKFFAWLGRLLYQQALEQIEAELQRERDVVVKKLQHEVEVLQHENKALAAVTARDLKRIEAETAIYARRIAEHVTEDQK